VEEVDLVFDGRIGDGRRLQAVAQRLVVELHAAPGGIVERAVLRVPVEDQVALLHAILAGGG
jgi:hypothetical protein